MKSLEELVGLLTRLPGIGKKSAQRVAWHLLRTDEAFVDALADSIRSIRESILLCSVCGAWAEEDPCPVCSSPLRDRSVMCVVEQPQDVMTIEASHEFRGLYHVLGGVISPIDGVGPEDIRLDALLSRLRAGDVREVVIATNPTVEGDTTALYVKRVIERKDIEVTRLATGIPVGGDLEYADRLTLARSFRGRQRL
ncbi:MAG: recombination mediator RecR [Treponema sp.]|nr:recombination mediator RecR [Treponema sp.]